VHGTSLQGPLWHHEHRRCDACRGTTLEDASWRTPRHIQGNHRHPCEESRGKILRNSEPRCGSWM